mmetsp:Transcript_28551/g.73260  ORF Transcript_28551/g.73260 Transcript_28551/m.73260 type:complete len:295 (-) Transcript_28551:238-1122(-)
MEERRLFGSERGSHVGDDEDGATAQHGAGTTGSREDLSCLAQRRKHRGRLVPKGGPASNVAARRLLGNSRNLLGDVRGRHRLRMTRLHGEGLEEIGGGAEDLGDLLDILVVVGSKDDDKGLRAKRAADRCDERLNRRFIVTNIEHQPLAAAQLRGCEDFEARWPERCVARGDPLGAVLRQVAASGECLHHGESHGRVVLLVEGTQPKREGGGVGRRCFALDKGRTHHSGSRMQHVERVGQLRHATGGDVPLEDTRLLACNFGDRVAEHVHVVKSDPRHATDEWRAVVGAVPTPA